MFPDGAVVKVVGVVNKSVYYLLKALFYFWFWLVEVFSLLLPSLRIWLFEF